MFENKDLDTLFKNGLETTRSFDRQDQQWEVVQQKLRKKPRRFFLWLLPFVILSASFVMYKAQSWSTDSTKFSKNESEKNFFIENTVKNDRTDSNTLSSISLDKESGKEITSIQKSNDTKLSKQAEQIEKIAAKKIPAGKSYDTGSVSSITKKSYYTSNESYVKNDQEESHRNQHLEPSTIIHTSTGDLESEQAVTKDDVSHAPNSPLDISYLPGIQSSLFHSRNIEFPTKPVLPLRKSQVLGLQLGSGIFNEFLQEDSLANNLSPGYFISASISYSNFHIDMVYKNHAVDRTIASNFTSYNAIDPTIVYGYVRPDSVVTQYTNHFFDLTLGYHLVNYKNLEIGIHGGVQARKINNGRISYTYGNIYNPILNEYELPNTFEISNIVIGSQIKFGLYQSLGLSLRYDVAIPLNNSSLKWPRRHQLSTGVIFTIK